MYKSTEEYVGKVLLPLDVGNSIRVNLKDVDCSPEGFRAIINYLNYVVDNKFFRTMELTRNITIVGVSQSRPNNINKYKRVVADKIRNMQLNQQQYLTFETPKKYRLSISYMSKILGITIKTKVLENNRLLLERTE